VVAGVLKEFKKAKIIGLKTPGLVSKRELIPLEDGSGLLLTSAVFHLSEKKAVWNEGIEPDIKIKIEAMSSQTYLEETKKLLAKL
jgi:carboxyl-terminal processing protease